MNENRRVVVTGIGAVTPLGNTVKDTWENLKAGKNGIAPIRLFDTEKFKAKLGAEVKGFDPEGLSGGKRYSPDRPLCTVCRAAAQQPWTKVV